MSREKSTLQYKYGGKYIKRYEFLPYINYTVLFLLISMVVAIPLILGLKSYAVDYVHNAQKSFQPGYSDIVADKSIYDAASDKPDNALKPAKLMGSISCDKAGLLCDVYYGINRVSMRDGVGLDVDSCIPGEDGCTYIAGYSSTVFGGIYNLKKGDKLVYNSSNNKHVYKVTDIKVTDNVKKIKPEGKALILVSSTSTDAFSIYDSSRYCVIATSVSEGEVLK